MDEASKTAFEGGVVSLTGSLVISEDTVTSVVDTFNSTDENDSGDSSKLETTVDFGTGVEMTSHRSSTVQVGREGGKNWIVVFAVFVLLGCINVHVTLQKPTLTFFGQPRELSAGNTRTTTPTTTSICSTVGWICEKIPDLRRQAEMQTMLAEFQQGDMSVIANISKMLHTLNLSQEIEPLLAQIQIVGDKSVVGNEDVPLNVTVVDVVDTGPVTDTYQALFSIFGVFSASLILLTNFRWVSVTGSVLSGVGCLGTAFCDNSNIHVVSFLYGALVGIGHNMILVSSIVAILTCFKTRRFLALLIPHIGERLGAIITSFLADWILPAAGVKTWESYLLLQSGIALAMIVFSFLLIPVITGRGQNVGRRLVERTFGFNGLQIYKTVHLYTFAFVFYCWYGGYSIIEGKLAKFKGLDLIPMLSFGTVLVLLLLVTALIGTCVSCCLPRTMSIRAALVLVSALSAVASLFNLLTSQMTSFVFALIYSAVLGLLKGVTDPVLQYAIPLVVGEEHVAIGTGVMTTGQGLGALVMTTVADQIERIQGNTDGCFYLTGGLHMLGCASAVATFCLLRRASYTQVSVTPSPGHPGKQDTLSNRTPRQTGDSGKQETVGTYSSTL